ncbi:MAG TPA: hypothetical protein VF406_21360 [Thermodesulfobacteriota bacterium]
MDRTTGKTATPPAEPASRLPLDLDEDPADESIYSLGYRARGGAVVADHRPTTPAEPATPTNPGTSRT